MVSIEDRVGISGEIKTKHYDYLISECASNGWRPGYRSLSNFRSQDIFAVKIFSRVALCAKIKRAEFSFLQLQHIYPGSYWAPSHKLGLHQPLHAKYLCKCAGHEHKRLL